LFSCTNINLYVRTCSLNLRIKKSESTIIADSL
jgi:hypothetical protein